LLLPGWLIVLLAFFVLSVQLFIRSGRHAIGRCAEMGAYDGVRPGKKADAGKQPPTPSKLVVPPLKETLTDAERMESARLARLAGQAKEFGVFFRLHLKPAPKEAKTTNVRLDPVPKAVPVEGRRVAAHKDLVLRPYRGTASN
jgi:hypothetical protein